MESYPTLKQRLASVLADNSTADVTFLVGDGKVDIGAHSLILAPASDVFKNMFYGSFNRERTVEVPDGTVEGFRALLSYVYTDEAKLTIENVSSALYLSDKYAVSGLYKVCIEFLKTNVTSENVCDLLESAEIFEDLKPVCDAAVRRRSEDVLKSEGFLRLSRNMMTRLIGSDEVKANELTVYERTVEWAEHHLRRENREVNPTSIREALGNTIYHIRFPLMEQKDFAAGPAASGILPDKDCLALYAWFALGKEAPKFCSKPRKPSTSEPVRVQDVIDFLELKRTSSTCSHMYEVRNISEYVLNIS